MTPKASAMKLAALLIWSLSTSAAAQDILGIDSAGRSAAGIVVGGILTDEQVRELLRRYNVLPFAVYFTAPAGRHEVPSDEASLDLIAEARRRAAQQADPWICHRIARLRSMQQSRRGDLCGGDTRGGFRVLANDPSHGDDRAPAASRGPTKGHRERIAAPLLA